MRVRRRSGRDRMMGRRRIGGKGRKTRVKRDDLMRHDNKNWSHLPRWRQNSILNAITR